MLSRPALSDLERPSFAGAIHFAQKHMRDGGRTRPDPSDLAELVRLLWFVPVWDGGFLHGDNEQRFALAERICIDIADADRIALRPGEWPAHSIAPSQPQSIAAE